MDRHRRHHHSDLTAGYFTRIYNIVFGIAIVVMLGFFLLQIMTGLIRREPAALTRAILGLAKSDIGSFLAVGLLATALEITDRLARGIDLADDKTTCEGLLGIRRASPVRARPPPHRRTRRAVAERGGARA